ncbi:response regulator transcription factor [Piscinibacter gummiphilus]|uniref:response regulator transcription factor n=1 Tax=Piscinibacter gummiphilus TaxID=946333 RepID=UPI001C54C95A|nr:response regulator [Piscinibacter gummiphilus]
MDDDAGVRRALSRVLREDGFDVMAFESATQFIDRADAGDGSCIVLDVSMPDVDGLQLQEQLAGAGARLPIVFVSGHADVPMCARAMKNGAVDFLTKPVDAHALVTTVRMAIDRFDAERCARSEAEALKERFHRLTEREREVLDAVVRGRLNKQIAAELNLVEQTVKFHRARLMEHMQARTVAELMLMAARLGLGVESAVSSPEDPGTGRH